MYIAMAKGERVNIRIDPDVKVGGNIVAEMESRTLSSLITDFLRKEIAAALKNSPAAYEEAARRFAKRIEEADSKKKKRKAKLKPLSRPRQDSPARRQQRIAGNSRFR